MYMLNIIISTSTCGWLIDDVFIWRDEAFIKLINFPCKEIVINHEFEEHRYRKQWRLNASEFVTNLDVLVSRAFVYVYMAPEEKNNIYIF